MLLPQWYHRQSLSSLNLRFWPDPTRPDPVFDPKRHGLLYNDDDYFHGGERLQLAARLINPFELHEVQLRFNGGPSQSDVSSSSSSCDARQVPSESDAIRDDVQRSRISGSDPEPRASVFVEDEDDEREPSRHLGSGQAGARNAADFESFNDSEPREPVQRPGFERREADSEL